MQLKWMVSNRRPVVWLFVLWVSICFMLPMHVTANPNGNRPNQDP